jgi:hypothetical protein
MQSRLIESRKKYSYLNDEVVLRCVELAPGAEVKSICSKIDYVLYSEKGTTKERVVSSQVVVHILKKLGEEGKVEIERRNNSKSLRFWPVRREIQ